MTDQGLNSLAPRENHGSETLSRYQYQSLLAVPFCVEIALGKSGVLAVYPEFVEDLAIEAEDGWRFIQVKSHAVHKPAWTLSETIKSGALSSLWRAHTTVRQLAAERDVSYELGIFLSGPIARGRKNRRDLLNVLVAHGDRGRLVDHDKWIQRIQELFDGCSKAEAEDRIDDLTREIAARVTVESDTKKRKLEVAEARELVELSFVEEKPPLNGIDAAVRLRLHELAEHLSKRTLDDVFDRLVGAIDRAASGARERTQRATLFKSVIHPPTVSDTQRLQAEAKRLSRETIERLIAPLLAAPPVAEEIDPEITRGIDTYGRLTASRLDYLQETTGILDFLSDRLVGREREQQAIVDFIAGNSEPRYLLLEADGGYGKSVLLAHMIRRGQTGSLGAVRPSILYFLIRERAAQNTAKAYLRALNSQLLRYLGVSGGLPASLDDLRSQFSQLWAAAQWAASEASPVVLFIDGLDEMARESEDEPTTIADLLPIPTSEAVRVIVSSRPNPPAREQVDHEHPLRRPADLTLDTFDLAGIQNILERVLVEKAAEVHIDLVGDDAVGLPELAQRVLTLTGGEPLFARFVAEEVVLGGPDALAKLEEDPPSDVEGYFRDQFKMLDSLADGDTAWEILSLFTVARSGLSLSDMAGILDQSRRTVRRAVAHFYRFLIGEHRFELMHNRLHARLCEEFSPAETRDLEKRILDWCDSFRDDGWPAETPEYVLNEYAAHLAHAGKVEDVHGLVDSAWMDRQFKTFHTYAGSVRDAELSLEMARREQRPDWTRLAMASFVIGTLGSLASMAQPEVIEVLARLERHREAAGYADLIEYAVLSAEAYARIASAALDRSDDTEAARLADLALDALEARLLGELHAVYRPLCRVLVALNDSDGLTRAAAAAASQPVGLRWNDVALAETVSGLAMLNRRDEASALLHEHAGNTTFLVELIPLAAGCSDVALLDDIRQASHEPSADDVHKALRTAIAAVCLGLTGRTADGADVAAEAIGQAAGAYPGAAENEVKLLAEISTLLGRHGFKDEAAQSIEAGWALVDAGENISPKFARALADLGDATGLERLLEITKERVDPDEVDRLEDVLVEIAGGFARLDQPDRAKDATGRIVHEDSDGSYEAIAWQELIKGAITTGNLRLAEEIALENRYASRSDGIATVALAWMSDTGTEGARARDRAEKLASEVLAAARAFEGEDAQIAAFAELARQFTDLGEIERAERLAARATAEFERTDPGASTLGTLSPLIEVLASLGMFDTATRIADSTPWDSYELLAPVAIHAHDRGDHAAALAAIDAMIESTQDLKYLSNWLDAAATMAAVNFHRGDRADAIRQLSMATDAAVQEWSQWPRLSNAVRIVELASKHGELEKVRPLLDLIEKNPVWAIIDAGGSIDDVELSDLLHIAEILRAVGDEGRAATADEIVLDAVHQKPFGLKQLAPVVTLIIQAERGAEFANRLQDIVQAQTHGYQRAQAAATIGSTASACGDNDLARHWLSEAFAGARSSGRLAFFCALEAGAPGLVRVAGSDGAFEIFETCEEIDGWFAS